MFTLVRGRRGIATVTVQSLLVRGRVFEADHFLANTLNRALQSAVEDN